MKIFAYPPFCVNHGGSPSSLGLKDFIYTTTNSFFPYGCRRGMVLIEFNSHQQPPATCNRLKLLATCTHIDSIFYGPSRTLKIESGMCIELSVRPHKKSQDVQYLYCSTKFQQSVHEKINKTKGIFCINKKFCIMHEFTDFFKIFGISDVFLSIF